MSDETLGQPAVVYEMVWTNLPIQPSDESVLIGFEKDEETHTTVVVTREAAERLAAELSRLLPCGESGTDGMYIVVGAQP